MNAAVVKPRTKEERDALVEQYLPLVRYVVARLPVTMPATLNREDFYSVGVMGLMHAAAAYDPTRGASFKTFAFTAIRGAVLDEIRKHDPVPRSCRDRLRRTERAMHHLHDVFGRTPTVEEIAEHLGVPAKSIDDDFLALHTCRVTSLDEPSGSGEDAGGTLGSRIVCEDSTDPQDEAQHRELTEELARAIAELPEVERNVVVLYHYENLYLKEIGAVLGVTESRVSQILSRATARLSTKMQASVVDESGE